MYRIADDHRTAVVWLSVGLACCTLEVEAAVRAGLLVPVDERPGDLTDGPVVVLVAGTVTEVLAPVVHQLLADLPAPATVVSVGACAATGGPYWDAPTVLDGVDQLVPVAGYVPGCPPRPVDLIASLTRIAQEVAA